MFKSRLRESKRANPMSFFTSNLYTITETEVRSMYSSRPSVDAENSSIRSSGYLTALPRWESLRNSHRPRLHMPMPIVPKRVHVRKESKTPFLEKDTLAKELGAIRRSDSQSSLGGAGATTPDGDGRPPRIRMLTWTIALVAAFLVLAIILGAVLGTVFRPIQSGPQPSVTEIPAGTVSTPTVPVGNSDNSNSPVATPHIASISATGWSVSGSSGYFTVWLFWQTSEGYLSRAAFNSSTGNWTRVSSFAKGKKNTPLTAYALDASWYAGNENYSFSNVHYESGVTYLDDRNYLNQWIFPDSGPEIGQPGPLNQQKYVAREDTKLASYWPHTVYQGLSGELRAVHYACHEKNECWHERVFATTEASNGTQIVVVPTQDNLLSLGLFYQEEGGRFLEYRVNDEEVGELWENAAFSYLIPPKASVASFSTSRSNSPKDATLNTYLLWQDANGTIQMSWADSNNGWKGPVTHPAFAGADNNTALACTTGLTFPGSPLPPGTEVARCYFQTGLALREVSFDGDSWNAVGIVPVEF